MLTPSAIDALPASRELDALVAEKIFESPCFQSLEGDWVYEHALEAIPNYSTSIAAAWEVVERLELVPIGLSSCIGDSWRLVKTFQGGIRLDVMTPGGIVEGPEADTAPLAICRAALRIEQAILELERHGPIIPLPPEVHLS